MLIIKKRMLQRKNGDCKANDEEKCVYKEDGIVCEMLFVIIIVALYKKKKSFVSRKKNTQKKSAKKKCRAK